MDRDKVKKDYLRHPHWIVFHPCQGAWNMGAVAIAQRLGCVKALIGLDTLLLWCRALMRRVAIRAAKSGSRLATSAKTPVVYLDLGLHEGAWQADRVVSWFSSDVDLHVYGFEANPDHMDVLTSKFANYHQVELVNCAVVGPRHEGDTVRLYRDGREGKGDSILERRGGEYIDVSAVRLSSFLRARGIDTTLAIILVRMNIEGAERYVIEDLVDAGVISNVDGFYGMWDDVYKRDPVAGKEFLYECKRLGVRPFTFNDRDLNQSSGRWRERAIRFDLETSMLRGLRRKNGGDVQSPDL